MSTELIPYDAPAGVSLVDIRMDPQRFPRLKSLSGQSAIARLEQVILMAYTYTGRPAPEDRCRAVALALYNELMQDKKRIGTANITIEEVGHAVKGAILDATEDVYINIAFLYRAVCRYATGEGHDAQDAANKRHAAQRQALLDRSPLGTMLKAYTGRMLTATTQSHNSKDK